MNRVIATAIAIATPLGAAAGCTGEAVDLGGNYIVSAVIPPIPNQAIDLLFVIDNSGSTLHKQEQIAAHAKDALFDVLDGAIGVRPDLHVGVIVPDMGTEPSIGDPTCAHSAEGRLVKGDPSALDTCPGIAGNFIVDLDDGGGGRITNYTGTLDEAFGCAVQVGSTGCGMERPLDALAAFLDNTANAGFLRPEAILVAVVITDEDDCSSANRDFFGPDSSWLGPIDSYRCFHHGVTCAELLDEVGVKSECEATEAPSLMSQVPPYRDLLVAAKGGDPTKVIVATITGDSTPIEVGLYRPAGVAEERLTLLPSCTFVDPDGATAGAIPALRLDAFRDQFGGMAWRDSLCAPTEDALTRTANMVGDVAARRACLRGELHDRDEVTAGIQPACRVFLATNALTPAETRREVLACDGDSTSCFEIAAGSATCSQWSGLEVKLRGTAQAANETLIAECQPPAPAP